MFGSYSSSWRLSTRYQKPLPLWWRAISVNTSERRPALHTLLRGTAAEQHPDHTAAIRDTLSGMATLVTGIHTGAETGWTDQAFTDVVNLGIGGSDLGPRFICDALSTPEAPLRAHFVANIDPEDLDRTVGTLDPSRTLFVMCSKSFTTEETLSNADRAKAWLQAAGLPPHRLGQHFIAVTTQVNRAQQWGIPAERCFPIWDWVGGRYSLWSAMGLIIPLALGWSAFEGLLRGARTLDHHTLTTEPSKNAPMMMALLEFWQTRYLNANTHAVLPYAQTLQHLPDFLQQLTMESNGKRVSTTGETADERLCPRVVGICRNHWTALLLPAPASRHALVFGRHYFALDFRQRRPDCTAWLGGSCTRAKSRLNGGTLSRSGPPDRSIARL